MIKQEPITGETQISVCDVPILKLSFDVRNTSVYIELKDQNEFAVTVGIPGEPSPLLPYRVISLFEKAEEEEKDEK